MTKICKCFCLICLFFYSGVMLAAQGLAVHDYSAELLLDNRSAAERLEAFKLGLEMLLSHYSGNIDLQQDERLTQALTQAENYVERYIYKDHVALSPYEQNNNSVHLSVFFSKTLVEELLHGLGYQAISSENRPKTLLWLAVDTPFGREIVTEDFAEHANYIHQSAENTGFPVLLPLMDTIDIQQVNATDVWGEFFDEHVLPASKRYGAEAVLVGRVSGNNSLGWQAKWDLFYHDKHSTWKDEDITQALVVKSALQHLAKELFQQLAQIQSSADENVLLSVKAIESMQDYSLLESDLRRIEIIDDLDVVKMEPGEVIFKVHSLGGKQALERVLASHHRLLAFHDDATTEQANTLAYKFISSIN